MSIRRLYQNGSRKLKNYEKLKFISRATPLPKFDRHGSLASVTKQIKQKTWIPFIKNEYSSTWHLFTVLSILSGRNVEMIHKLNWGKFVTKEQLPAFITHLNYTDLNQGMWGNEKRNSR